MNILSLLHQLSVDQSDDVASWFASMRESRPLPIYSSVDIRYNGTKLAPVDTNLFPAGFNNLAEDARARASFLLGQHLRRSAQHYALTIKKILLLTENHTRNQGYLDNVAVIQNLLECAGYEVLALPTEDASLRTRDGYILAGDTGFCADAIVLNHDLTSGVPEYLQAVHQPVLPPVGLGWHKRRKSCHFRAYNDIVKQFSSVFGIDPWLMSTVFHRCGKINFKEQKGLECVAIGVEKVLHQLRDHYARYNIDEEPYVFVKADAGTYGMGVMHVRSGEEAMQLNKKLRNKMNVIKEGADNTEVIIQEGVRTMDTLDGKTAEPLIYSCDAQAVGGIWRVNAERDAYANLNTQSMQLLPMSADIQAFSAYKIIADLAALAAAEEAQLLLSAFAQDECQQFSM